jgi:diadenylate cyclase
MSLLHELKTSLRPADFLDIAVVSVFVYAAIRWSRRARSRFMLLGIATLAALYFAARLLNMYLTLFLFQVGFTAAVVTIVVVFQEDIRRAFERIATVGLARGWRPKESPPHLVDVVVRATQTLTEQHHGALFVFKGKEPLERHITEGIVLDGRLSEALVASIFDTSSAGHDGALVIEKGIVTRFAVHLPLSTRPRPGIPRGTRHAAAIGLSEVSDALVVVVSEERSTVSLAQGGVLTTLGSPSELVDPLTEFLRELGPERSARWYQRLFTRNLGAKALSVVIACAAWLAVIGSQSETLTRTLRVPIVYGNLPRNLWLDEPTAREATVTLSGSSTSFRQLDPSTLAVSVDLSHIAPGDQRLPLTENQLNLPPDVSVYRIDPATVSVSVFRSATIEVPIKPQLLGRLPAGMQLGSVSVMPPTVRLDVRRRDRRRITQLVTTPVDLEGLHQSQSLERQLIVPSEGRLARGEPGVATITLTLKAKPAAPRKPPEPEAPASSATPPQ